MEDNTNENQAALSLEDLQAEIESLRSKNATLLQETKDAKSAARTAQLAAETKQEEATRLASERETAEAEKAGDIERLKKSHSTEIERLKSENEAIAKEYRTATVNVAIANALGEGKVMPHFRAPLEAMFRANEIDVRDGVASIAGQPLGEYVAAYLATADGQHFVEAPSNGGGNANRQTGTSTMLKQVPVTAQEWAAFDKLSEAESNALAEQWGRPDLKV